MNLKESNEKILKFMQIVPTIKSPPSMYEFNGTVMVAENVPYNTSLDMLKPVIDQLHTLITSNGNILKPFKNITVFSDISEIYSAVIDSITLSQEE